MPFINTSTLLKDARNNHYAIGAFNIENLDMALAVVETAEELKMPVIIQTTYTTVNQGRAAAFAGMINSIAAKSRAEIALHLDHGNTYDICVKAIGRGYTSVMIDGSSLPLYKNISLTKRVVDYARLYRVSVEGEIGKIGGIEDEVLADVSYTDVNDCIEFVEKSGIDFVAIGVGTSHGLYKGEANIDMVRIQDISDAVQIPLVLHGASGLCDEILIDCIKRGISKINFATEMRMAYTQGIRSVLEDKSVFDPKQYQLSGRNKVKKYVESKMKLLSSQ